MPGSAVAGFALILSYVHWERVRHWLFALPGIPGKSWCLREAAQLARAIDHIDSVNDYVGWKDELYPPPQLVRCRCPHCEQRVAPATP